MPCVCPLCIASIAFRLRHCYSPMPHHCCRVCHSHQGSSLLPLGRPLFIVLPALDVVAQSTLNTSFEMKINPSSKLETATKVQKRKNAKNAKPRCSFLCSFPQQSWLWWRKEWMMKVKVSKFVSLWVWWVWWVCECSFVVWLVGWLFTALDWVWSLRFCDFVILLILSILLILLILWFCWFCDFVICDFGFCDFVIL